MKKLIITSVAIALVVFNACKKSPTTPVTDGTVYLDLPQTSDQYYTADTFNNNNNSSANAKATLGRVLFYDTHLSVNNAVSCGSCHKQNLAFADDVAFSSGFQGALTKRNSRTIENLGGGNSPVVLENNEIFTPLFWDGREDNLSNLADRPLTNHVEMGIDDLNTLSQKLSAISYYPQLFINAYGSASITPDEISDALAMFTGAIHTGQSRFEQYQASNGTLTNLSALEMEGMNLFLNKYNCGNCHHVISNVYDSTEFFRNIGLDQTPTDLGRGVITGNSADNGKFKVPNLENVAVSAPYMHDGRYKTLSDVIDHYSHGIQNTANLDPLLQDNTGNAISMNISDQEKQAIIAFLNTMTDYNMLTDPKFSNPFKVK